MHRHCHPERQDHRLRRLRGAGRQVPALPLRRWPPPLPSQILVCSDRPSIQSSRSNGAERSAEGAARYPNHPPTGYRSAACSPAVHAQPPLVRRKVRLASKSPYLRLMARYRPSIFPITDPLPLRVPHFVALSDARGKLAWCCQFRLRYPPVPNAPWLPNPVRSLLAIAEVILCGIPPAAVASPWPT